MSNNVNNIHVSSGVVYIAGVECPVADVMVAYGVGKVPELTLTVPAVEEFIRFGEEDRVPVAVFYLDQWYSKTGDDKNLTPTMRLLFDGEIYGWSYSKSANGDSISLFAIANIQILQNINANFLIGAESIHNSILLDNINNTQEIIGGGERIFPLVLLNKGLFATTQEPLERPFDFIENLLLAMKIGGYPNDKAFTATGTPTPAFVQFVNSTNANSSGIQSDHYQTFVEDKYTLSAIMGFFVRYVHKTRFDKRWIATPLEKFHTADSPTEFNNIEDPTFLAVKNEIQFRTLQRTLENTFGQGDSFLKILTTFYSLCSYEVLMLPTAQYVTTGKASNATQSQDGGQGIPVSVDGTENTKDSEKRLGSYISKPICPFALPPVCNIVFPCMVETFSFQEDYSSQPTRTISGNPFLETMLSTSSTPAEQMTILKNSTNNGYPTAVMEQLQKRGKSQYSSLLLYPEEYFKGPVTQTVTIPAWFQFLREGAAHFELNKGKAETNNNQKAADGTKKADQAKDAAALASATAVEALKLQTEDTRNLLYKAAGRGHIDNREMLTQYTRLLHHEARFGTRAGSVDMAFNPYIVPGFPFVMFDRGAAKMHVMGTVSGVTQRLSATGGLSTSIQYNYGRTLKETYEIAIETLILQLKKTSGSKSQTFYATAPLLPVKILADTLQTESEAEKFYKRLFFNSSEKKDYVYKFSNYIKTSSQSDVGRIPQTSTPITSGTTKYQLTVDLVHGPDQSGVMTDYNKALKRISRPICTLEEYVQFINGNVSSEAFTDKNQTAGENVLLSATIYGVPVPSVIKRYIVGDPLLTDHYVTPVNKATSSDTQELRRDWVAKIQSYRTRHYARRIIPL